MVIDNKYRQTVIDAYREAQVFADAPEGYDSDKGPSMNMREVGAEVCLAFIEKHAELIEQDGISADLIGHDLWMTRNGHGVGFWDRGELTEEAGHVLTESSRDLGECYVYIASDGYLDTEENRMPAIPTDKYSAPGPRGESLAEWVSK